jgi:hypothetical protein
VNFVQSVEIDLWSDKQWVVIIEWSLLWLAVMKTSSSLWTAAIWGKEAKPETTALTKHGVAICWNPLHNNGFVVFHESVSEGEELWRHFRAVLWQHWNAYNLLRVRISSSSLYSATKLHHRGGQLRPWVHVLLSSFYWMVFLSCKLSFISYFSIKSTAHAEWISIKNLEALPKCILLNISLNVLWNGQKIYVPDS